MNRSLVLPVLCSSLSIACSAGEPVQRSATVRDSAGIQIVENSGDAAEWRLSSVPAVRLGVVDGDPNYQFHNVLFAGRLTDSKIVVVENGSAAIHWYGPSGTYVSTLGQRGGGPGEFERIESVLLTPDDNLAVYDSRNQRVTLVSAKRDLLGERRLMESGPEDIDLLRLEGANELLLARRRFVFDLTSGKEYTYTRDTLVISKYLEREDTITRVVGSEAAVWARYSGGRPTATMKMDLPFGYETLVGATRDNIVLASADRQQLELLDANGTLRRIARRTDFDPAALSQSERTRYVQWAVELARSRGRGDPTGAERNARELLNLVPEDHHVPPFDRMVVDAEDRIWLRDYSHAWDDGAHRSWTIYEPDGRVAGRALTPANLRVTHISADAVTGVERDDLDVEYVGVYIIERP